MTRDTCPGILAAVAIALLVHPAPAAQEPQTPPRPTFRTELELVTVDVTVVDNQGDPVQGLAADDFSLAIDGRPRRITSAQFVSSGGSAGSTPREHPAHYSSNEGATGGRLIALVIDQGGIQFGRGRHALESASKFVSTLEPADRVALYTLPGTGPYVDFTGNHELIAAALRKVVGQAPGVLLSNTNVGMAEALDIARGDEGTFQRVAARECGGETGLGLDACLQQVRSEAQMIAGDVRQRTTATMVGLRVVLERLAEIPAPKAVVFVSEGIYFDRDFSEAGGIAPLAARAQAAFYMLQLAAPVSDVSSRRQTNDDITAGETGLSYLAGLTRGSTFRVVSQADFAFERVRRETAGYYLLSFEPDPGDRDGRTHRIRVEVPGRRGLVVRARRDFRVEEARPRRRTTEEELVDALRIPLPLGDLGLRVTSYNYRDAATGRLRVVFSARVDRSQEPSGVVALGYAVVDAQGRIVTSHLEERLSTPVERDGGQAFVGAVVVPPGAYTLKIAAIHESGTRGSVEHPIRASLQRFSPVQAADLLLADATRPVVTGLIPAVDARFSGENVHAFIEIYADDPAVLRDAAVIFEVSDSPDGVAFVNVQGHAGDVDPGKLARRAAEAVVPIGLLPPGDYVVRAAISVAGERVGHVSRPFSVTPRTATVTAGGGGAPAPIVSSRIDAFHPDAVLGPDVVGYFLGRLPAEASRSGASRTAYEHARGGDFDAAVSALGSDDRLAATFLDGLARLSRGELEAAAGRFREALRLDSEFFPAAFYLGACYAAGGRDREAVGAWQTALVTETDAPFIFTLLGDALLRLRDVEHAVQILEEAAESWPDDEQVQMRLGTALVMAGRPAEALPVLDRYLSANPADDERLFLALRAIYEVRSGGQAIASPEEDRRLFDRYATLYAAAGGAQQAMVDQWRRFMEKAR